MGFLVIFKALVKLFQNGGKVASKKEVDCSMFSALFKQGADGVSAEMALAMDQHATGCKACSAVLDKETRIVEEQFQTEPAVDDWGME